MRRLYTWFVVVALLGWVGSARAATNQEYRLDRTYNISCTLLAGTATFYAVSDAVGTMLTFDTPGLAGSIDEMWVIDKDKQNLVLDVIFFTRTFVATADNAALDLRFDDLTWGFLGVITGTPYTDFATSSVAHVKNQGLRFRTPQKQVYAQVKNNTANTGFSSTESLKICIRCTKD